MKRPLFALTSVLVTVLLFTSNLAQAQTKPFKISGSGIAPSGLSLPGQPPAPHWIIGEATHLGRHTGEGSVRTDSANFDPSIGPAGGFTGEFGSGAPFVFVAANGDKLVTYYGRTDKGASEPGTFTLVIVGGTADDPVVVAAWLAEFVVQPELSTGKFAGVTGKWVMDAWSEPFHLFAADPVEYSWEGEGELTFPQPVNWKVRGTGTTAPTEENPAVDADVFSGHSSQLGRYTGTGFHELDPSTGAFVGEATYTAANGDQLFVEYAGQIVNVDFESPLPFEFVATVEVVGGTGRFADATGGGQMEGAFSGSPGDFVFTVAGTLQTAGE